MQVRAMSDYLEQQEHLRRERAYQIAHMPVRKPRGIVRRLLWRLRGQAKVESNRRDRQARAIWDDASKYAKGRVGEDALVMALAPLLNDHYLLVRNYTPPRYRQGGDIDAVLIGPHGVVVFEVKAWRGLYRYSHDEWMFRPHTHAAWEPTRKNPTWQASQNQERVRRTLSDAGLGHIPVRALLVVADPEMHVTVEAPLRVPLLFLHSRPLRLDFVLKATPTVAATDLERVYTALVRGV